MTDCHELYSNSDKCPWKDPSAFCGALQSVRFVARRPPGFGQVLKIESLHTSYLRRPMTYDTRATLDNANCNTDFLTMYRLREQQITSYLAKQKICKKFLSLYFLMWSLVVMYRTRHLVIIPRLFVFIFHQP